MANLDHYYEAVRAIRATGRSSGGTVTVVREPGGEIDVQIRTGTVRRLGEHGMAAEIRSGLLAAVADHRRQFIAVRTKYFGSPLYVTPFTPPEPVPVQNRERA